MKLASVIAAAAAAGAVAMDRPIIGVLTLPQTFYPSGGNSYFPASYVKWLESGGARVVPIPYDSAPADLSALLKQINGALFTGGGAAFFTKSGGLTQYATTAQAIFNESLAAAAAGETWPLWGTCLGFELINVLGSDASQDVLTPGWDSENISLTVDWTADAATSRLWGSVPEIRANFAAPNAIALNAHQQGVSPAAFAGSAPLSSRFTALATSQDRNGKTFVASVEAKDAPIYATQWHPEKVAYEWLASQATNHSAVSVVANGYPALWFAQQARANDRAFARPADEQAALIYNYEPVFTLPKISTEFEQCYFFPAAGGEAKAAAAGGLRGTAAAAGAA